MIRCGLNTRLLEIQNNLLKIKSQYRFGIVDDVDEFKFTSRSIGVIIDGETTKNGQRYVNLSFYYSENKIDNQLLNFRDKVREFIEFLDNNEDNDFDSSNFETKIEYGNIEDETQRASLRTAIIKKTYRITNLLIDIDDNEYQKMSENIYLKCEEGM
ncbi:MAG: hypothetical protein ACRDDY_06465 [Clostridium sp.]|uniref:hypothetical protein n=1 Tax=Clostridium sp. TaxID=1506 RepID=UPI003EE79FA7